MLSAVRKRLRKALKPSIEALDVVIGLLGRTWSIRPEIRRVVKGEQPGGTKHAVYVHFDRWGVVHDFIHQALRELGANGYSITFVSNAPKLADDQIKPLLPLVREVVHRRNVGYDFAAYRDGIARLPPPAQVERLILANDSVYGPVFPLAQTLAVAEAQGCDAFGITDTWEHHYHLQSYFLLFFPNAIRSPAFAKFWRRFPSVGNKGWLIRNGEVRLSSVLARERLRLGALCPYWDVSRSVLEKLGEDSPATMAGDEAKFFAYVKGKIISGKSINPSHYYWDTLITDWKCPYLKRELIQSNPAGIPRTWQWEALLREKTAYDTNLVVRHLQSL